MEIVMSSKSKVADSFSHKRLALAIVFFTALLAAAGFFKGFFTINAAVGVAVCGIVIGTGVSRGAFSGLPDSKRE